MLNRKSFTRSKSGSNGDDQAPEAAITTASNETVATDEAPPQTYKREVDWIEGEPSLFDQAFYEQHAGRTFGSRREAAEHYIAEGEKAGYKPSIRFDAAFYLAAYDDVRAAGVNALAHYAGYGRNERRYPVRAALREDADAVEASGLFQDDFYVPPDVSTGGLKLSAAEHYILFGGFAGISPSANFDSGFYLSAYDDVRATRENPLVHFLRLGVNQRRYTNPVAYNTDMERVRASFEPTYYRAQFKSDLDDDDLLRHYLLEGVRVGLNPSSQFSDEYYSARNHDLSGLPSSLFAHYTHHGRSEGRLGRSNFMQSMRTGLAAYDPERATVVIANHEASRTGAPLVGLAIARKLSLTHNVITYLGRSGSLEDDFNEVSTTLIPHGMDELDLTYALKFLKQQRHLEAIIANSVESDAVVRAALAADVASVLLLHEFAEYTLPVPRASEAVAAADRVLVPARIVRDSVQSQLQTHYGAKASNVVVCPQGYLNPEPAKLRNDDLEVSSILESIRPGAPNRPKIVLGAGHVQIRKGVEMFVQTAAEVVRTCGEDVCFLWVGDGYNPDQDLAYSLWISEAVKRSGLEDNVFFFPVQSNLDRFFSIADAFYLPSRLDPFPNVAIDALNEGLPVVCFEGATGIAEIIADHALAGAAVPYGDVSAAARALVDAMAAGREASASNAEFIAQNFGLEAYIDRVMTELEQAVADRKTMVEVRDRIAQSGAFDAAFSTGRRHNDRALTNYVARASKGLAFFNPAPGFSDGLYKSTHGYAPDAPVVALDLALAERHDDQAPTTHVCNILRGARPGAAASLGVALHLHLHYPELASFFATRLQWINQPIDVFITTTERIKSVQVEAAFANYTRGAVDVRYGPNRGRDIGPFFTSLGETIAQGGYGLVGHLHGKKSKAVGGDMGDRWRDYLIDHLLGAPTHVNQIFSLFTQKAELGLIFAEDRHSVGWSKNLDYGRAIVERLGVELPLPAHPVFPLGNMFWARTAAIQPLWNIGLTWDDYPGEPAPYDGTILHALERILPSVVKSTGYTWETVYKPGSSW